MIARILSMKKPKLYLLLLLVLLYIAYKTILPSLEGFELSPGVYPKSVNEAVLDDYPKIGKNKLSNNNYEDIWWKYPVFSVGSYEQITNNIRYNDNPDIGTCIRADFCGAVYNDAKNMKSNVITPLPPSEEGNGARVGYYRSEPNKLYFSIPTNENILY